MGILTIIAFGASFLGYLVICLLLLTVPKNNLQSKLLFCSLLASLAWSVASLCGVLMHLPLLYYSAVDCMRWLFWMMFLMSALTGKQRIAELLSGSLTTQACLVTPVILFIVSIYLLVSTTAFANQFYAPYLLYPLVLCALTEAFYRRNKSDRWAIRPICLGLGALFIFDFYLYSEALLLGAVSGSNLIARAGLHFAVAPLLLLGTKRNPAWDLNIFVSRDVVMQSTMLLGAGIYLTLMAGVGYYIKATGASWSSAAQSLFLSLAFVLLVALFMSEGVRKRLRVYIAKHFFANKHDYRQEWLALTENLLNADPRSYSENALNAALQALKYSGGCLTRMQGEHMMVLAALHTPAPSPPELEYLAQLKASFEQDRWVIDCDEYLQISHRYTEKGIVIDNRWLAESCYRIIIPLFVQHSLYGLLLLAPESARKAYIDWEERDYMDAVTNQVVQYLAANDAGKQLAQNAQFAAFNQMSAFVVHDIKNVQAQISLLIKNGQKYRHNPEFIDDAFETLEHMQKRLARMLEQLKGKKMNPLSDGGRSSLVSLKRLIDNVIRLRQSKQPIPQVVAFEDIEIEGDEERLLNILLHLVENAQDATPDNGEIEISVRMSDDFVTLGVRDNGCGMTSEFINEGLFTPFVTTKGNAGMGIGVYEAKKFAQECGGELSVVSQLESGTEFRLKLPRVNRPEITRADIQ